MHLKILCVTIVLFTLVSCSSQPTASNNAPSGKWSGEYNLSSDRTEPISLELTWESEKNLRGVVHAGARALPLTKAVFKPDTGAITMEFDTEGNGGRTVHYVIDGKVNANTMTGTWTHDDQHGDFRVTKQ
jgi:hypothetical protein